MSINLFENYFPKLYESFIKNLSRDFVLRDRQVPHIVLNTGDDTMFVLDKGYNYENNETILPTNENYTYMKKPYASLSFDSIEIDGEDLTQQYSFGYFKYNNKLIGAEFQRIPLKMKVSGTYIFDSLSSTLEAVQYIATKLIHTKEFYFYYLGSKIQGSYIYPASYDKESKIEIKGQDEEQQNFTFKVDYEIESYIPSINENSIVEEPGLIKEYHSTVHTPKTKQLLDTHSKRIIVR